MELQESVRIIQAGMAWANWTDEQKQAMLIAMEAINKQIPQKVIKGRESSQQCPKCGSLVNGQYCKSCGQKLSY